MKFWKNKFSVITLVTLFYSLDQTCAQNIKKLITIPVLATNYAGPKKFERIIVPVYPTLPHPKIDEDEEKPVTEKLYDVDHTTEKFRLSTKKPKKHEDKKEIKHSNKNDDEQQSYSYVSRSDGYSKKSPAKINKCDESKASFEESVEHKEENPKPKEEREHKTYGLPNMIQPLHIKTNVFKKSKPKHTKHTTDDHEKMSKDHKEKLKLENLPENPDRVPKTDWFDNLGKYNYKIVHETSQGEDDEEAPSVEDSTENESKKVISETEPVVQKDPEPPVNQSHPPKFRSNFRDPKNVAQVHHLNDNKGKFLYKSEVFYPQYRDHLYLPFTTHYGNPNIFPRNLPVYSSHTVYHPPNPVKTIVHNIKLPQLPVKVPIPIPKVDPTVKSYNRHSPPNKVITEIVHKVPMPPRKPVEMPPQKPQQNDTEEDEEEYEDEPEESGKAEKYDYEEGDSDDEEDEESSSQKYREESSEDCEDEEKPKYSYSSFKNQRNDESGEDEFDKAWRKYGYSPKDTEENESSESRIIVQEIEPERKKIVHMKMEYKTEPYDGSDATESSSNVENIKIKKPLREMTAKMSGTINNAKDDGKKRKKNKNKSVKSQQQHPNAGPDDLKFFQYLSHLGNGEHLAGGRVGNDRHYIEQHERGSKVAGAFQKKVKWADKDGGFGEHFWDLKHGK